MSFLGSIAGPLVSGLFGMFGSKKSKQPQTQVVENRVNYEEMVASAERAGFDPLTVLRNGGSAGFSSSTTTHPGLSGNSDVLSQIGGALGDALGTHFDPNAKKQREVESALLDYQLDTIQGRRKAPFLFGDVPMKSGTTLFRQPSPPMSAARASAPKSAKANAPGEGTLVGGDNPTVSSLGLNNGKYGIFHAPGVPDAEIIETIYGDNELYSTLGGTIKAASDAAYTVWRNAKSAYQDLKPVPAKPKKKYSDEYRRNIRETVPSLASPPRTTW